MGVGGWWSQLGVKKEPKFPAWALGWTGGDIHIHLEPVNGVGDKKLF